MTRGSHKTLHYYVLSRGTGYRTARFIRLWNLDNPEVDDETDQKLMHDILEMVFCRVFQTLPAKVLGTYFDGLSEGQAFANVGLNVMPPLFQSVGLGEHDRQRILQLLLESPDPEVRGWLARRAAEAPRHASLLSSAKQSVRPPHNVSALSKALDSTGINIDIIAFGEPRPLPNGRTDIETLFKRFEDQWREATAFRSHLTRPFGDPSSARVGFILDVGDVYSEKYEAQCPAATFHVPKGFEEQGFSESSCMIWGVNMRQYSSVSLQDVSDIQTHQHLISDFNWQLIHNSSLRVILLCDKNVLGIIASRTQFVQLQLVLYGFKNDIFIERSNPERIFIHCSGILPTETKKTWAVARRVDDLIRFAVCITKTKNIRSGVFETSSSLSRILRQAKAESEGHPRWTADTLDVNIKAWLFRKGFSDDGEIRRLEGMADSLTRGLLMMLRALPRRPPSRLNQALHRSQTRDERRHHIAFDPEQCKKVAEFVKKVTSRVRPAHNLPDDTNSTVTALEQHVEQASRHEKESSFETDTGSHERVESDEYEVRVFLG